MAEFDKLPEEIQNLLYSPEMYAAVKKISAKHQLHIDQMDLLETEVSQVLMGELPADQLAKMLAKSLNIEQAKADVIAKDVNDEFLSRIREVMKNSYEANKVEPKIVGTGEAPKPSLATAIPISKPTLPVPEPTSAPTSPTPSVPPPAPIPPPPVVPAVAPIVEIMPKVEPPKPVAPAPTPAPAPIPVSTAPLSTTPHPDQILSEPTVSKAPETPTKPAPYSTDPYREPPIP